MYECTSLARVDQQPRPVAHAPVQESPSGSGSGFYEMQKARLIRDGFDVAEVPDDGREHPIGRYCPTCTPANATSCMCWYCREGDPHDEQVRYDMREM